MVWTIKERELVAAIKAGSMSDTKKALEAGADVNAKDRCKCSTPLMYACANPNITPEIIQLLLDHGADVNAKDNEWWTPLMYACANRHSKSEILHKIIKILVKYKADLSVINKFYWTALMHSLDNPKIDPKTNKWLIDNGADINHQYYPEYAEDLLRMEQKLNAMQQDKIADMTKDITKLEAQQALNKLQAKKIAKQRMRALRLGQYRHR